MGTYERDISTKLEKDIVSAINGKETDTEISKKISEYLAKKYAPIEAIWTGGSEDGKADIKLLTSNGPAFIEIKYTYSSKGTLANISQDAITTYNLIDQKPWSVYRELNRRWGDKLSKHLFGTEQRKTKDIYRKAKELKGTNTLKRIKEEIKSITRDYISLLRYSKQSEKNIERFCFEMFNGNTTRKLQGDNSKFERIIVNKRDNNFSTDEYFAGGSKYEIIFPKDKTSVIITVDSEKTLRLSFAWKDIGYGIKGPRIMVFDLRK